MSESLPKPRADANGKPPPRLRFSREAMLDRPLPADVRAEGALVGACMVEPDEAIPVARAILIDGDVEISNERLRIVYTVALAQYDAGDRVLDAVTLYQSLGRRGLPIQDAAAGALQWLSELRATAPAAKRAGEYAQIVHEHHLRRQAIHAAYLLTSAAFDNDSIDALRGIVAATQNKLETPSIGGVGSLLASEIEERPTRWLWQNWLERGALNLLAADPGVGKSTLTAAITAVVTSGGRWPDNRHSWIGDPQRVVFLASEDDPSRSTVPRLRVAGANLPLVSILGHGRALNLADDLDSIDREVSRLGNVGLIIIDPIDSYIRGDSNKNEEVRAALEPVARLAEKHDAAVLVVKHLTKMKGNDSASALYRVAGSVAYVALPRAVHVIGFDPDDETNTRRIIAPIKVSHGPKPDALAYTIKQVEGYPVVAWEPEAAGLRADDVLGGRGPRVTKVDAAAEFIAGLLADGPRPSSELDEAGRAAGYTAGTIRNAREKLGIVPVQERIDGKVGRWLCALPGQARGASTC